MSAETDGSLPLGKEIIQGCGDAPRFGLVVIGPGETIEDLVVKIGIDQVVAAVAAGGFGMSHQETVSKQGQGEELFVAVKKLEALFPRKSMVQRVTISPSRTNFLKG